MVCPVAAVVEGDADQGLSLPAGAGDQGPARLTGVAGLHAGTALVAPEEFIVVGQAPALQGDGFGGDDLGHGVVLQAGRRQSGHVQGRSVVVLIP